MVLDEFLGAVFIGCASGIIVGFLAAIWVFDRR